MSTFLRGMTNSRSSLDVKDDSLIEIDEETRERLQLAILDMYKDVFTACQKYNIIPYLIGGSALGAVRHKGFIPWDDDLDIKMLREDYDKFNNLMEQENNQIYKLVSRKNNKRYANGIPRVIDTRYRLIPTNLLEDQADPQLGVF